MQVNGMLTYKFSFALRVFALHLTICAQTAQSGDILSLNSAPNESRIYNEILIKGIDAF